MEGKAKNKQKAHHRALGEVGGYEKPGGFCSDGNSNGSPGQWCPAPSFWEPLLLIPLGQRTGRSVVIRGGAVEGEHG